MFLIYQQGEGNLHGIPSQYPLIRLMAGSASIPSGRYPATSIRARHVLTTGVFTSIKVGGYVTAVLWYKEDTA